MFQPPHSPNVGLTDSSGLISLSCIRDNGIPNNAPLIPPVPVPEVKPLDKVKEPPRKRRSREREER